MRSKSHSNQHVPMMRRAGAIVCLVALLASTFVVGISAQNMKAPTGKSAAKLSEDQRILHVLNRLGFGALPGDVERVKAMGIDNYIAQQLSPEKIDDSESEAKLQNLETLRMSTADLYEKYPQPGQLLRQLQQRGALPADLAQARDNRVKGGANAAPAPNAVKSGEAMPAPGPGEMQGPEMAKTNDAAKTTTPANNDANPMNNPEYRKAVMGYFKENNLRPAQFLTGELQMSRILRAVYSERQLQEVMVDFWTNHFNVYAAKGADRWLLTSYDRDTIRPRTLGKFYDLLVADAQSPAMLFYLDNFQSVSPNAQPQQRPGAGRGPLAQLMRMGNNPQQKQPQQQQRRGINENYARELMELHTLGVDGGYTQKDVQEVARCFTGWTIFQPRGGGAAADGSGYRGASSGDSQIHRHQTCPPLCRRRTAAGPGRSRDADLHQDGRRHPRSFENDLSFTGVQLSGSLSGKSEAAVRTRRQLSAHAGRGHQRRPAIPSMDCAHGPAALWLSDAEWLFGHGRELGEHRRAARAHEFCPGAGE